MSTENERRNKPAELAVTVSAEIGICVPGGHQGYELGPDELTEYNADPDAFAAEICGLSKFDYLQWIDLDGAALCGARTKGGDFCRNIISHAGLRAHEWQALHRIGRCPVHGGPKKNERK